MPALFSYLLKANIALTLFFLCYYFGLRRLTFYTLNRVFLLAGIAFSAVYPAIDLSSFFQRHQQLATRVIYYWQPVHKVVIPASFTIWNVLVLLFWAGAIIMFIRFILQLSSLKTIHRKSISSFIKSWQVRTTAENIDPFSFFNNIYLNPSSHTLTELDNILKHEAVHVRQWHTLDVLAAEINTIFYWFNPGAWLMKNAVKQNLEFIADRKVLSSGADSTVYQYNLVNATVTQHSPALANKFNLGHLKNRIIMMNKQRSSRINLLKYLLLLPLVLLVLIFTISNAQVKKSKHKKAITSFLFKRRTDTVPQKQLTIIKIDSVKKSVYFVNNTGNNDSTITNIKVVTTVNPGVIKTDSDITVTLHGNDTVNTHEQVYTITPDNRHDSTYTISGRMLHLEYTDSGRGREAITIPDNKGNPSQTVLLLASSSGTIDSVDNGNNTPVRITITQDTTIVARDRHPLYLVDGKIVHSIKNINPANIASVNVLKNPGAIAIYGQQAKDGVVIITLKKSSKQ